jgi:hypothetical protein
MGAFTVIRDFAEPASPAATTTAAVAADPEEPTEPKALTPAQVAGKIADYIPAEGIVGYLTAYAIVSPAERGGPIVAAWVALAVGVVTVALFGLASILSISKRKKIDRRKATVGAVFSIGLIVLYVSLLPDNPFEEVLGTLSWLPQIIALIATTALGLWGDKLKPKKS